MVIMSNGKPTDTIQMLTPRAVADMLGVHQKTVHLWLRTGKLKGVKLSYRAWRIPRPALEQFLEEKSNVLPLSGTEERNTRSDILPGSTAPGYTAGIQDTSQEKMKRYIRDIMGEQIPEKDQNLN